MVAVSTHSPEMEAALVVAVAVAMTLDKAVTTPMPAWALAAAAWL